MASEHIGERTIQGEMESAVQAKQFYDRQVLDSLTDRMIVLIRGQEMVFVATADTRGNCDCSPRFGNRGFVLVVDKATLAYPEYRGNGVFASLGNILENPHVGLVFIDFFDTTVGLHVNGKAHSYPVTEVPELLRSCLDRSDPGNSKVIERWVVIEVEEAYIHCSKHVPALARKNKAIDWGTDDPVAKSSNFFVTASENCRPATSTPEN